MARSASVSCFSRGDHRWLLHTRLELGGDINSLITWLPVCSNKPDKHISFIKFEIQQHTYAAAECRFFWHCEPLLCSFRCWEELSTLLMVRFSYVRELLQHFLNVHRFLIQLQSHRLRQIHRSLITENLQRWGNMQVVTRLTESSQCNLTVYYVEGS